MSNANDKQIGGDHYKHPNGEEHWDRQWRLFGPGYFVGCITKYVERYRFKNGIQDLEKAAHFLQKLIELETATPSFTQHKPEQTVPAPHSQHPLVQAYGSEHAPTGWVGYTFEGAQAHVDHYRCKQCRVFFTVPVHANPNDHHACATEEQKAGSETGEVA